MPLRHGLSSLGCAELTLEDTLALAERCRIDAVELRALGGQVDLAGHFRANFDSPDALRARLSGKRVEVCALNASFRLLGGGSGANPREELADLAPWAEALEARWLRIFDGGSPDALARAGEMAGARDTLAWWADLRRRHGWRVDLMIETHDSLWSGAAVQRLVGTLGPVAILWDAHHTWRKGGEDPGQTWSQISPWVVHVHVKDSIPEPSARHPFTYVLPGRGGFPMAAVRSALEQDGFGGVVSLEWERMWHPYLPPLEEALREAERVRWW